MGTLESSQSTPVGLLRHPKAGLLVKSFLFLWFLWTLFGCDPCPHGESQYGLGACPYDNLRVTIEEAHVIADDHAVQAGRPPSDYETSLEMDGCDFWLFYVMKDEIIPPVDRGDPRHFTVIVSGITGKATLMGGQ